MERLESDFTQQLLHALYITRVDEQVEIEGLADEGIAGRDASTGLSLLSETKRNTNGARRRARVLWASSCRIEVSTQDSASRSGSPGHRPAPGPAAS
jgi:hypothetical protein